MLPQSLRVPVISVRLNPEDIEFLRKHKLKPGPFLKEAAERELRHMRMQEALEYLDKFRAKQKPDPKARSSTEIIRWDRDHGH